METTYQKSKPIKGIYKVIQYVAVCEKCDDSYIANNCSTQRQFTTQFRKEGWRLSIDNKVTCEKCNRAKKEVNKMEAIKEVQELNCPMCEEGLMEYKNIKGLHTYSCEMCPFQGIEGIDYTIEELIEDAVKKEK